MSWLSGWLQVYSAYGGAQFGTLNSDLSNSYSNSAPNGEGGLCLFGWGESSRAGYSFDFCEQHASTTTTPSYHSHVPPPCLLNQLGATTTSISPQIGWMVDGVCAPA